jgi:hypothetical protein
MPAGSPWLSPLDLRMTDRRRWTRARPLRRNASLVGAGRNAASGRNVGHVRANGAATVLYRWFPWVALTKGRQNPMQPGRQIYATESVNPVNASDENAEKWSSCGHKIPRRIEQPALPPADRARAESAQKCAL